MISRRLFSQLALGSSALVFTGSYARSATLDGIKKAGVLRVAVLQDYAPFGSIGSDMAPVGFDVDLAKAFAAKMGVKLELTPVTGQNRIPFLQTGKIDLIIACLGKTPEREKAIAYSAPYALTFNGVYGAGNVAVTKPADLAGKTISASRGGTEDLQVTEIAPANATIKRFEDTNGTLAAYSAGQVDLFATGSTTAAAFSKVSSRPFDLKFRMKDELAYIGVSKSDPTLLVQVNTIIAGLRQDGTLNSLSEKWLGSPMPNDL